jgi:hypothetical protein
MESALSSIVAEVQRNPGAALCIIAGALFALFLLIIALFVRQSQMARRQARLLRGADGASLERMLQEQGDYREAFERQIGQALHTGDSNASQLQNCFQRMGIVRYDAFPDVGGEQSFSVALLDMQGNGLILSGLHSRHDVRIYAKPLSGGVSPVTLTEEERQAIASAKAGGPDLLKTDKTMRTSSRR